MVCGGLAESEFKTRGSFSEEDEKKSIASQSTDPKIVKTGKTSTVAPGMDVTWVACRSFTCKLLISFLLQLKEICSTNSARVSQRASDFTGVAFLSQPKYSLCEKTGTPEVSIKISMLPASI